MDEEEDEEQEKEKEKEKEKQQEKEKKKVQKLARAVGALQTQLESLADQVKELQQ